MSDVKITAARQAQSAASKQDTLARLRAKKRRTRTVEVEVNGEKLKLVFGAISSHDLDALQGKHTPTVEQRARGMNFNPDTFGPALVAACLVDPEMSYEEALEIWTSTEWSTGELQTLFSAASELCMEGMNVPFSGTA